MILLMAGAALLLHVPQPRVPMIYDMVGYVAQAHGLLTGHGNTIAIGADHLPGIYPVGVPALAAAAMALLGPDLRNGLWAVLACAVLVLPCVYACLRRAGLSPWAGTTAALAVLCSLLFRQTSGYIMSQVPTALAVAVVMWLFLARDARSSLFLAGLVAMLSLLLRYANVSFPVALVSAELLCGGSRRRPRLASLAWLGAGLALGGALVLTHNAILYDDALATGYRLWGWNVEGQFSLANIFGAEGGGYFKGESILLSAFFGLSELQSIPMLAASVLGLIFCWRDGCGSAARPAVPEAWLLGGLSACTIGASYLLLACYSFRSESYLVPTVPAIAVLVAYGASRTLESLGGWRAARLAPVLAGLLLLVSLVNTPPPRADVESSVMRLHSLQDAGERLEANAALITTADSGLVEPLFRTGPSRSVLYLGPFVSPLLENRALAELGADSMQPRHVVDWAVAHRRAGQPVYLDQNPPPRGLSGQLVAIRTALRTRFALVPTAVDNIFKLSRLDTPR